MRVRANIGTVKPLIYITAILGTVLILAFAYCIYEASLTTKNLLCDAHNGAVPESCYSTPTNRLQILALCFAILAAIHLTHLAVRFKQLSTGVNLVQITARPINALWQLFLFPLCQLLAGGAILVLIVFVIVWILSNQTITIVTDNYVPGQSIKVLEYTGAERGYLAIAVFLAFWWLAFLSALGEGIMAVGVAIWYYTREKSTLEMPLLQGLKYVFRYHIGSFALGSILHFYLYLPNLIFSGLTALLRKSPHSKPTNALAKLCYCLFFYERWLKHCTKFTYIFVFSTQIALFAEKYSISAPRSYYLIHRHRKRLILPVTAGWTVIWAVKVVIAFAGPCVTYYSLINNTQTAIAADDPGNVVSASGPSFVALMLCVYIAQVFGGALDSCMNSMLVCSACDEEMFTNEQRHMQEDIADFLENMGKEQTQIQAEYAIDRKSHKAKIAFDLAKKHQNAHNTGSEAGLSLPPPELFQPKPVSRSPRLFANEDTARSDQDEVKEGAAHRPNQVYSNIGHMAESAESSKPSFSPSARARR